MEVLAVLTLRAIKGIGDVGVTRLTSTFGSAAEALRSSPRAWEGVVNRPQPDSSSLGMAERRGEQVLSDCVATETQVLLPADGAYPASLRDLPVPPPALFLKGRIPDLSGAVAIVGSRRATAYGRRVAETLASSVAGSGAVVVSGMALGIDGAAHQGALLRGHETTVAVLGSRPDVPSPPSHRRLYEDILMAGGVVSEFAPGTPPAPHHFPRRNRIIAALATRVVVVEAAQRSGALITAECALELGREVYAVPGPVDRPNAAGSNELLADGAGVVADPTRLPWLLGPADPSRAGAVDSTQQSLSFAEEPGPILPSLDPIQVQVLEALANEPAHPDRVANRCGLPIHQVAAATTVLELRGFVTRTTDGRYSRALGGDLPRR